MTKILNLLPKNKYEFLSLLSFIAILAITAIFWCGVYYVAVCLQKYY